MSRNLRGKAFWAGIALAATGGAALAALVWELRVRLKPRRRIRGIVGQRLPSLVGETLTGRQVRLPDDTLGDVVLLVVGFSPGVNDYLLGWSNAFRLKYGERGDVTHFMITLPDGVSSETQRTMETHMRELFPPVLWERVLIVGAGQNRVREALSTSRGDVAAYLVDREGQVVFHTTEPSEARFADLSSIADHVLIGSPL